MDPAYKAKRRQEKELMLQAEALPSDDVGIQRIFNFYNSRGLIPRTSQRKKYKTLEKFMTAVQNQFNTVREKNPDLSDTQALNQALNNMAVKQRLGKTRGDVELAVDMMEGLQRTGNVDYQGIPLKIQNGVVKINNRAYMDELPLPVRELLQKTGQSTQDIQAYTKAYKREWREMGAEGRALLAKYGIKFDRGHFTSSNQGGARSRRSASLELSALNMLHGAEARGNIEALKEAGKSDSWISDYYLWKLEQANLAVLGADYLTDADLEAIAQGADVNSLLLRNLKAAEEGNFESLANQESLIGQSLGQNTLKEKQAKEYSRLYEKARATGVNPRTNRPFAPGDFLIPPPVSQEPSHIEIISGGIRWLQKPPWEKARDLFMLGQSPELTEATESSTFGNVQDPFKAAAAARDRGPKIPNTIELGISEFFMPPAADKQ